MSSEFSEYSDWGEGISVQPRVTIPRRQQPSRYRRRTVTESVRSNNKDQDLEPREVSPTESALNTFFPQLGDKVKFSYALQLYGLQTRAVPGVVLLARA